MCIRDRVAQEREHPFCGIHPGLVGDRVGGLDDFDAATGTRIAVAGDDEPFTCLLYTSDAADDLLCVDLGGRRIIKKKKQTKTTRMAPRKIHHNDTHMTHVNTHATNKH